MEKVASLTPEGKGPAQVWSLNGGAGPGLPSPSMLCPKALSKALQKKECFEGYMDFQKPSNYS